MSTTTAVKTCAHCGAVMPTHKRGESSRKVASRKYCSIGCFKAFRIAHSTRKPRQRATAPPPPPEGNPIVCPTCGRQIVADDAVRADVIAAAKTNHARYCHRDPEDEDDA